MAMYTLKEIKEIIQGPPKKTHGKCYKIGMKDNRVIKLWNLINHIIVHVYAEFC